MLLALFLVVLSAAPVAAQGRVAVTPVTVVDVTDGSLLRDHTVLVEGDRITAVGPAGDVAVPAGAEVVDGAGRYLIPGLWDMHVHLFNNISRRQPSTWAFPLFIAHGVTGVREMWTELASLPVVERWRRERSAGELTAPRVLAAGALVDGPGAWYPNMPEVTTPSEGRRFVRAAARAGTDFIKVYSHLAPEVYRAVIDEARKVGLPVAGHIPLQVRALESARAGQRTNEHLHQIREACTPIEDGLIGERRRFYAGSYEPEQEYALLDAQVHRAAAAYDEATCERVARDLAESGQWQVPTLVNERRWFLGVPRERLHDSRLAYLPAAERAAWERRHDAGDLTYEGDTLSLRRGWQATKRVVEVLGRSGVGLLVGTDFGNPFVFPGASVHEEMELLVESGFTPLAALQAATSKAAAFMYATDDHGSVTPGKLANLVLLDANPLADITNTREIAAVVLDGSYLDRAALDSLLTEAERTAHHDTVQEVPPLPVEFGEAWVEAANAGDLEAFVALYADDVVRFPPGAEPVVGREAVRAMEQSWLTGNNCTRRRRRKEGSSLEIGRSAWNPSGSDRRSGRRGR